MLCYHFLFVNTFMMITINYTTGNYFYTKIVIGCTTTNSANEMFNSFFQLSFIHSFIHSFIYSFFQLFSLELLSQFFTGEKCITISTVFKPVRLAMCSVYYYPSCHQWHEAGILKIWGIASSWGKCFLIKPLNRSRIRKRVTSGVVLFCDVGKTGIIF